MPGFRRTTRRVHDEHLDGIHHGIEELIVGHDPRESRRPASEDEFSHILHAVIGECSVAISASMTAVPPKRKEITEC